MQLSEYYRDYTLAWEVDPEEQRRFRRLMGGGMLLVLLLGVTFPLIHLPRETPTSAEAVPERLARLMAGGKAEAAAAAAGGAAQAQTRGQTHAGSQAGGQGSRCAQKGAAIGIAEVEGRAGGSASERRSDAAWADEESAGRRRPGQSRRALADRLQSRSGLGRHHHRQRQPRLRHRRRLVERTRHHGGQLAHSGRRGGGNVSKGGSGKPSRSEEEIALVFDSNKGAIYALYGRALRDTPELQGKLVLEFTISPAGEVTECHVVSSELKDAELERKIVARVKLFRFAAKDVATITTTKPIEFVPTA
jgi:protein TonB